MASEFVSYMADYNFPIANFTAGAHLRSDWPLRVKPISDRRLSDLHLHNSLQIWYTVSGEYQHLLNGIWQKQTPGSVLMILPFSAHQIDSRASDLSVLEVVSVTLPLSVLTEENIPFLAHTHRDSSFRLLSLPHSFCFSGGEKETMDALFRDMLREFRQHFHMDRKKLLGCISTFFETLSQKSHRCISSKSLQIAKDKRACIDHALSYILANSSEPLTLEKVSREAMMSQRNFTSAFSDIVGQTYHSYIMHTKINHALRLLRETNASLDVIADTCGFHDRSHLIRLFKRNFGVTPSALRDHFLKWNDQNLEYAILSENREYEWLL